MELAHHGILNQKWGVRHGPPYGGFKVKSPVIVFNMEQVVPKDVYRTKMIDQKFSDLVLVRRKLLGE